MNMIVASVPSYQLTPMGFNGSGRNRHPLDCPWCGTRQHVQAKGACNECDEVYMFDQQAQKLVTHPESLHLPFNMRSMVLSDNAYRIRWASFRAHR